MATAVYLLCFVTSTCCAWLLVRSYLRTRTALLLWTAICVVLLALNTSPVAADLVCLPALDLRVERLALNLIAVAPLLDGFIAEFD